MTGRSALVFPVGHYAGAADDDRHWVRCGWMLESLTAPQFAVWARAFGDTPLGTGPWSGAPVVTDAEQPDARAKAVGSLTKRGLLVSLPSGPAAVTKKFLRGHRIGALLTGIRHTAEDPGTYRVGLPGTPVVASLDFVANELWQWGPVAPSLWHICEIRAKVSTELGEPMRAGEAEPDLLADLRTLLASGCLPRHGHAHRRVDGRGSERSGPADRRQHRAGHRSVSAPGLRIDQLPDLARTLRAADTGDWSEAGLRVLADRLGWQWRDDYDGQVLRTGTAAGDARLRSVGDRERARAWGREYVGMSLSIEAPADTTAAGMADAFRGAAEVLTASMGPSTIMGAYGNPGPFFDTPPSWGSPFRRWRGMPNSLELKAGEHGLELLLHPT